MAAKEYEKHGVLERLIDPTSETGMIERQRYAKRNTRNNGST